MISPFHSCHVSLSVSEDTHLTQASLRFLRWNQNNLKWTFPNWPQLKKPLAFKMDKPPVCFTFDA